MEFISIEYMLFVTSALFVMSFLYNLRQRKMLHKTISEKSTTPDEPFYDLVTDLPNRKNIEIIINENIKVASRRNKTFCILALKALDYFEIKNDSIENSNRLSIDIADGILSSIRDEDTAARVSQDEYIVVFNEYLEIENFDIPMDRISKALKGKNIRYSYITYPDDADTAETLINGVIEKL